MQSSGEEGLGGMECESLKRGELWVKKLDESSARHVPLTRLLFDSNLVSMTDMMCEFKQGKA